MAMASLEWVGEPAGESTFDGVLACLASPFFLLVDRRMACVSPSTDLPYNNFHAHHRTHTMTRHHLITDQD
jgi:hypothetical protein